MRIVTLTPRYIEEFAELLGNVVSERRWLAMTQPPLAVDVEVFVLGSQAAGGVHVVAIEAGAVVGWADVRRLDDEGYRHVGRLGMGVAAPHRGRGVGRALLDEVVLRAARRGVERVELEVFASNVAAVRLYERSGFVHEGVKRRAWRLDGREDDIVLMARWVGPPAAPAESAPLD
jgi:ribosomal protein S18 acetylase RimI-like enzyme